jgi:hypothetical protein
MPSHLWLKGENIMLKKVLTDKKDNPEKEDRLRVMLALSDKKPSGFFLSA